MVKGFRQIASLTVLSRILGMVRDVAFAHFFGAGWLNSAWTLGFKIPNLTRRLFGEGAASASFIPVYSEQLQKDPNEAKVLANTVISVLFVLLAAIVLVGELILLCYYKVSDPNLGTRTGLVLCSMMMPYMICICLVAILAGILNVHKHFATPAAAPIVLNISIIGSLLITGFVFKMEPQVQVLYVACGVLLAGLAQIAIQIPALRASGVMIRPAWQVRSEAFKKILVMMGPMILGLTVTQINTLADDLIALSFSNDEGNPLGWGAISHLYYSQRLYQFPLGVLGISLATAIFPVMSADAARKDYDALCKTISRGFGAAMFVALPATVGMMLIARPLVSVLFEHGEFTRADTNLTAWTLSFYVIGLWGYFSQQIATRAFYATQDSKVPAITAMVAVGVNIIGNLTLLWFLGTAGLALSTAICSYLQVIILVFVLRKRYGGALIIGLKDLLVKTITGTILMGLAAGTAVYFMRDLPQGRWYEMLRIASVVSLSALVYIAAAKIMRNKMFSLIASGRKS